MNKKTNFTNNSKLWLVLIAFLTLFLSCQKEQFSADGHLIIQTRAPFDGEQACGQLNIALYEQEYETPIVISKQEEIGSFKSCVEGSTKVIDFNKEFLVAVRICSACGILKKQEVTFHQNKLIYSIDIQNTDCAAITCSNYYLLIPKKYVEYPIEMNITKY